MPSQASPSQPSPNASAGIVARGGCQCGAVRYAIASSPLLVYACHCSACQRQSGAAFGMSMVVAKSAFTIERGVMSSFEKIGDSGRKGVCLFCPACGSRIAHTAVNAEHPTLVVKPGTLDDTSNLAPCAHFWVSRAQAWTAPIRATGLQFDEQPADFEPVFRAWRERQASAASA